MSLKKLGVALLAVFVLGAIAANSAFATNEFKGGGTWTVAGANLAVGSTEVLETEAVGTQKLVTTIGGTKLDITATGVNCLSCTIQNLTGTVATADGTLEFTGVSITEPLHCKIASTIKTNALTATLGMNTAKTLATLKFAPASGTTFAVITIEDDGTGLCGTLVGTYKVQGSVYGQAVSATGVTALTQELTLNESIQKSAGEANSLKFGENPAIITGAIKGKLKSGKVWGGAE